MISGVFINVYQTALKKKKKKFQFEVFLDFCGVNSFTRAIFKLPPGCGLALKGPESFATDSLALQFVVSKTRNQRSYVVRNSDVRIPWGWLVTRAPFNFPETLSEIQIRIQNPCSKPRGSTLGRVVGSPRDLGCHNEKCQNSPVL